MPVPTTNTKLSGIQTEFGGSNPIAISEYYAGGANVPASAPAPNGPIPGSGQIAIGQFRGSENIFYTAATGGTITTSGDYKIHTFTSGGTFDVTTVGNAAGGSTANYLIVAGGGNSGTNSEGAGAGAGGWRQFSCQPLSVQGYPISIGGPGGQSSGFGFTSNRGGQGGSQFTGGQTGGSGGGAGFNGGAASAGNQPPVSPPQGNPGGTGRICGGGNARGGGGGGANAAGQPAPTSEGGDGGQGKVPSFNGSPSSYYAGGGCGNSDRSGKPPGTPGQGQGANTGGGGGAGASGFPGIVIISYKYQN
jgi:hypothetical protein